MTAFTGRSHHGWMVPHLSRGDMLHLYARRLHCMQCSLHICKWDEHMVMQVLKVFEVFEDLQDFEGL